MKIQKPKEPATFDRPRIYAENDPGSNYTSIRIIYPNGDAQFTFISINNQGANGEAYWDTPCWHIHGANAEDQLKEMRRYDRRRDLSPADFLGEI